MRENVATGRAPTRTQREQEPPPQHCDADGFSPFSVSTAGAFSSAISGLDEAAVSDVVSADMRSMLRLRVRARAGGIR